MTTQELVNYYANLLRLQYVGKPKARATVAAAVRPVLMPQDGTFARQVINFSVPPTAGYLDLRYGVPGDVPLILTPADDGNLQYLIRNWGYPSLSNATVTGSMASGQIVFDFSAASPAVTTLLVIASSAMTTGGLPVVPTVDKAFAEPSLPLAVQNGFNIDTAVGAQLDMIGKTAGVSRTGSGFTAPITLGDADFRTLIRMAIIKNSAGSSLAEIQALLAQFFPGTVFVFDYANMQMSYLISTAVGSQSLVQLFVTEGLLPKPMGVSLGGIIYSAVITTYFGFRTYAGAAVNVTPFNSYSSYLSNRPWLSYANAFKA